MGLMSSMLEGAIGGEMVSVVNGLIERHGGVQGLVAQFEQQGFGSTIASWVGTGANQPITPEQLQQAIGSGPLQEIAQRFGMSPDELTQKLTQVLPKVVDHLTPSGVVRPS